MLLGHLWDNQVVRQGRGGGGEAAGQGLTLAWEIGALLSDGALVLRPFPV